MTENVLDAAGVDVPRSAALHDVEMRSDAFGRQGRQVRSLDWLVTALGVLVVVLVVGPGCASEGGVGDPCTLEMEYEPSFLGADVKEAWTESNSFQCRTRLCLVNHFQGRSTCAYGQNVDGLPPPGGTAACSIPTTGEPVTGKARAGARGDSGDSGGGDAYLDARKRASVEPQCVDRRADRTVYCSCRCADVNGDKPANENFCDCPDGFTCTALVLKSGFGNEGLTGSYCIKSGTEYNPNTSCHQGVCDPRLGNCP